MRSFNAMVVMTTKFLTLVRVNFAAESLQVSEAAKKVLTEDFGFDLLPMADIIQPSWI
jgi:hypothetical protein